MIFLAGYFAVGVFNYVHFAVKNRSYVFRTHGWSESLTYIELIFFTMFWPLQILFYAAMNIKR